MQEEMQQMKWTLQPKRRPISFKQKVRESLNYMVVVLDEMLQWPQHAERKARACTVEAGIRKVGLQTQQSRDDAIRHQHEFADVVMKERGGVANVMHQHGNCSFLRVHATQSMSDNAKGRDVIPKQNVRMNSKTAANGKTALT